MIATNIQKMVSLHSIKSYVFNDTKSDGKYLINLTVKM